MSALRLSLIAAVAALLCGCMTVAGAAVGTAVGVTGAAVGATAKGAGMVVGAVIPDGDDEDRDERRR
jgi:hypothetical protein